MGWVGLQSIIYCLFKFLSCPSSKKRFMSGVTTVFPSIIYIYRSKSIHNCIPGLQVSLLPHYTYTIHNTLVRGHTLSVPSNHCSHDTPAHQPYVKRSVKRQGCQARGNTAEHSKPSILTLMHVKRKPFINGITGVVFVCTATEQS